MRSIKKNTDSVHPKIKFNQAQKFPEISPAILSDERSKMY